MKVIIVLGVRPEIIKLSCIIRKLESRCELVIVHTGQNSNPVLNDIFFEELQIRKPDYFLGATGTFGQQIGVIFPKIEEIFIKEKPDRVLMLGDVNSGLCAIVAERMGIKVFHMEAGNRCGEKMAEEINRGIIDSVSTINLPYTNRSRDNLIREGYNMRRVFITGNPIYEVLKYYMPYIDESNVIERLGLLPKTYFLATFHRQECVDNPAKLQEIIKGLTLVGEFYKLPIIVSTHPRTKSKLTELVPNSYIQYLEAMGFFDFVNLEKNALCIISDSGTCCEEGTIMRVPTVVCRNAIERPEVIEVGSTVLSGINGQRIFDCTKSMVDNNFLNWDMPEGYIDNNVSEKVINHLLGEINV